MILSTIASALGLIKGGVDLYQSYTADNTVPKYVIPPSAISALNTAKYLSSQKSLPGSSLIQDAQQSNSSGILKAIQQTTPNQTSSLGALAQLFANQGKQNNALGIASAQNWTSNQKYLANAQNNMAQWEAKKANWEVYQPFQQEMANKANLEKAGWMNIANSLNSVAGYQESKSMWDKYIEAMGDSKNAGTDFSTTPTNSFLGSSNTKRLSSKLLSNPVKMDGSSDSWDSIYKGMDSNLVLDPVSGTYKPWSMSNKLKF